MLVLSWSRMVRGFTTPLLKFGVISDVQFADIDDGLNHAGTRMRRYRQSLATLHEAREVWEAQGVDFAVSLGDLIDAKASKRAVDMVREAMGDLTWHVAWGNHDFSALSRSELQEFTGPPRKELHYAFSPVPGVRCVLMDAYYQSVVGAAGGVAGHEASAKFLASKNPNIDPEYPRRSSAATPGGWLKGIPEDSDDVRFVMFNGGFGQEQVEWFKHVLADSNEDDILFVFSHVPVFREASRAQNCAWDFHDVLNAIDQHPRLKTSWFAGHDHDGGFARRSPTQSHVTPPAPLECDPGQVSYGTVSVFPDGDVRLDWRGKTPLHSRHPWPTRLFEP